MPRKRSRYGSLLEKLRATNGTVPDSGEVKNFHDYLTGVNKITQVNKIPDGAGKLYSVGLLPFAIQATSFTDPGERYKANISLYAYNGLLQRVNAVKEDFGIFFIEGGELVDQNYFPALIKPSYVAENVDEVEGKVSAVTQRPYDYQYNRTFQIPFGRSANAPESKDGSDQSLAPGAVEELDVLKWVRELIFSGTGSKKPVSASYEPELFRIANAAEDLTGTLPTEEILPVG